MLDVKVESFDDICDKINKAMIEDGQNVENVKKVIDLLHLHHK